MLRFRWTQKANAAALALGKRRQQVAAEIGVTRMTLWRWLQDTEFSAEVDRLTLAVDLARRAHRLRVAMRAVRAKISADGTPQTSKDLLDWLKYVKGETDAHRRDCAMMAAAESVAARAGPMAG